MSKNGKFLDDALNRYGEKNKGKTFNTTQVLHGLVLRNGNKFINSIYVKGSTTRNQAVSLHYALLRHPRYTIAVERVNSKEPNLWRYD